ncbi:TPA: hypothetical protein OZT14_003095 [Escherichia coli]|nr:hypothetical protein [Escherichia coli]HCX4741360.1 hypothetical protein [Escherichia coli]
MARKIYISMTDMAKRYGYTLNAIKAWRAEGLPYSDNPAGIPEDEGTLWIVQNKINPMRNISVRDKMEKEKLREQIAKADLATYTAQEKSGELIPVEIVQSELNKFCQSLKDSIRLIPSRHAIEILEYADDVHHLKHKLREIIDNTLLDMGDLFEQEYSHLDEIENEEVGQAQSEIEL